MINVYKNEKIVGRVNYNNNLDYLVRTNWQNGRVGRHKGITKLRNGSFVIIYGTDWQWGVNTAEVVTDEKALIEILESGKEELLEEKKFARLKELYERTMMSEVEYDE